MSEETHDVEKRREWLNAREIAALFYELMRPHSEEQNRIAGLQLKEAQKASNALFMLTGDGTFKGQLPMILDELAEGKKRAIRTSKRVRRLELQRKVDHEDNRVRSVRLEDRLNRELRRLHKEMRSIRRNQLWVVQKFRSVYDWCTSKDDQGRYSSKRLAAFAGSVATAAATGEEFARHYIPIIWLKISAALHAIRA